MSGSVLTNQADTFLISGVPFVGNKCVAKSNQLILPGQKFEFKYVGTSYEPELNYNSNTTPGVRPVLFNYWVQSGSSRIGIFYRAREVNFFQLLSSVLTGSTLLNAGKGISPITSPQAIYGIAISPDNIIEMRAVTADAQTNTPIIFSTPSPFPNDLPLEFYVGTNSALIGFEDCVIKDY